MRKSKIINTVILLIALFAIFLSFYFYYQLKHVKSDMVIDENKQDEIKSLVDKVSKLYLIPKGEEPTIATVSDPEVLKDQSFFTLSEKGDKVFIFKNAGRAVLYRPSIDKIIEVAPIKNESEDKPKVE